VRVARRVLDEAGDTAPAALVALPAARAEQRSSSSGRVLVLNASYEPINVCTVRRAAVLVLKEKAEVIEVGRRDLHWARGSLPRPVVIRLVTYVRIPRDPHRRKITRRAVFARDGWQCQYCGARTALTVDHVIPRSKGGGSSWDNIVASCAPCNRRKGDRLPHQIDMHPRVKPRTPGAHIFIQLASPTIPATWKQYLPLSEAA
jgi:5-methylcytosine-specific restriction endonuclease McrA